MKMEMIEADVAAENAPEIPPKKTDGTKEKMVIVTICTFAAIFWGGTTLWVVSGDFWLSLALMVALTTVFVRQGITEIPANPPYCGLATFFGKRTDKVLSEGIKFLPFYKIVFDLILVKMTKANFDIPSATVRIPDGSEIVVIASATLVPDEKELKTFLSYGSNGSKERATEAAFEGIKSALQDIITSRIRAWATSEDEGPVDWKEAVKATDEALIILIKSLFGKVLEKVPSDIPTATLFKYLSNPPNSPNTVEAKKWGKNWERLDEYFKALSPEKDEIIKKAVGERRMIVEAISRGEGEHSIPKFGTKLLRFNLREIKVIGETAKAAEQAAKEEGQARAAKVEIANVNERVGELVKGTGLTPEAALRAVQVESGKVTGTTHETLLTFNSGTIKELLQGLLQVFGPKKKGKEEKRSGKNKEGRADNRNIRHNNMSNVQNRTRNQRPK